MSLKDFLLPSLDERHADAYVRVLSRRLPLLYATVLVNSVLLAKAFAVTTPTWMAVPVGSLLAVLSLTRIWYWWRLPVKSTPKQRHRAVINLGVTGPIMAGAYMLWALMLYQQGDYNQQALARNFIGTTGLICILCLSQSPRTSLYVAFTVVVPAAVYFLFQDHPNAFPFGLSMLVTMVILVLISAGYHRDLVAQEEQAARLQARERELAELASSNARLATLDALTGVPNHRAILERIERELRLPHADRIHLALIDLDGFKQINDTYGHGAGDALIVEVARRMEAALGEIPFGRLGGDEFAILFPSQVPAARAEQMLTALVDDIGSPFQYENQRLRVTASIGVYRCGQGDSVNDCLECADTALYRAKEEKGSAVVIFTQNDESRMIERRKITQTFNSANLEEQIGLVFQPIYDTDLMRPVSFEALARWTPDGQQWLPPSQFVQIAEATGRIGELTRIVVAQAVRTCPVWDYGCSLSINLSAHDLLRDGAAQELSDIVTGAGVSPERIMFEITETALISDYVRAAGTLEELRECGFRIALDDFGTGQSSLSHVHKLPLDTLKIDQSFAFDIHRHDGARTVIGTIVTLARQMELTCVIEGIETHVQRMYARNMGIRLMQGYLFGRPMNAAATLSLLSEDSPVVARKGPRTGGLAVIRGNVSGA